VIRWTTPAQNDFLGILEWVGTRNPQAAARVGRQIISTVELLGEQPYLGKPGRSADTREIGVPRFPYLVVYDVLEPSVASDPAQVVVLRILHGAMLWPRPEGES
jgi:toxin ParE1/3/4